MSYDLMVLDKHRRFKTAKEFLQWYDKVTEWADHIDYNDPLNASPSLQAWFMEIKDTIPPMNGQFAPPLEEHGKGDFREADYCISHDAIYGAFALSDAERVYSLVSALAKKHDVALFDISGSGEVIYPDGTVLSTNEAASQQPNKARRRTIILSIMVVSCVAGMIVSLYLQYHWLATLFTCLLAVTAYLWNKD